MISSSLSVGKPKSHSRAQGSAEIVAVSGVTFLREENGKGDMWVMGCVRVTGSQGLAGTKDIGGSGASCCRGRLRSTRCYPAFLRNSAQMEGTDERLVISATVK